MKSQKEPNSSGSPCLSENIQGLRHSFEGTLGPGLRPLHLSSLPADISWRQPKPHEGPQVLHTLSLSQAFEKDVFWAKNIVHPCLCLL